MRDLITHIIAEDPPSKWVRKRTAPKQVRYKKSNGEYDFKLVHEDVQYLTANLFYAGSVHWATKQKVVDFAKNWLFPHLQNIPKIEKCNVEITYFHPKDTFDLDNKVYFWSKMFLDILKTPTQKQLMRAAGYNSTIKTINCLIDDTVRYVDGLNMKYEKGNHRIEIKIFGRLQVEQIELF